MKIIMLFCFALAISLSGCSGGNKPERMAIELNNGLRWNVDPLMLTHLTTMEKEVANYGPQDNINRLQASLKDGVKKFTSNCTMQGSAHDELHKWLLPFMETVNTMNSPEDITELKQHFILFHTYFK